MHFGHGVGCTRQGALYGQQQRKDLSMAELLCRGSFLVRNTGRLSDAYMGLEIFINYTRTSL